MNDQDAALDPLGIWTLDRLEAFYASTGTNRGKAVVALVAEVRTIREAAEALRPVRAQVKHLLDGGTVTPPSAVQVLRGVHADLDAAVAACDKAVPDAG